MTCHVQGLPRGLTASTGPSEPHRDTGESPSSPQPGPPESSMIPFYAWNPARWHALRTILGSDHEGTSEWSAFVRQASGAEVALVVIESERAEEEFRQLQRFAARHATRILLILDDRLRDDTLLARVSVHALLRFSEIPRRLAAAITMAQEEIWRREVAAAFARSDQVPQLIKDAIAWACQESAPPRTVQAIARAIGSDPVAIAHRWRSFHSSSIRFQDVLHWIQLDWGCLCRPRHRDWIETAEHIGMSRQALSRHARRCVGMSLSDLRHLGRRELHRKFAEAVLVPLFPPTAI